MKQVFESARIRYVEVSELLIPDYLTMVNDVENVQRYIGKIHDPFSEEKEIRWVRKKLEEKAPVFSMIEKSNGQFIGNIELMDADDSSRELGIAITANKQNMGYGTEAVAAITAYGLNQLGLARVFLRTSVNNARAIHVYTKCGFQEYDRSETHVFMEIIR